MQASRPDLSTRASANNPPSDELFISSLVEEDIKVLIMRNKLDDRPSDDRMRITEHEIEGREAWTSDSKSVIWSPIV